MQYEDLSEEQRKLIPPGVFDLGGGKSVVEVDDEMVQACREGREFCSQVFERGVDLAKNIKMNGADFDEAWAGLMQMTSTFGLFQGQKAAIMLAYVFTRLAQDGEAGLV